MTRSYWVVGLAIVWPSALLALVQVPNPPPRPSTPESAYPACLTPAQDKSGTRAQLAALRACRSSIEHYRQTYLTAFRERLRLYAANLERYRAAVEGAAILPDARQVALDVYRSEKEQLESGGDLFETRRRLTDRAERELGLIGNQICRLRHRPGNNCA